MDVVRFSARRAHLIDSRIPEEVTKRVAPRRARPRAAANTIARDAIIERTLHLGYGATLGAAFAALAPRASAGRGAAFGFATWLLGSGVVLPALRVRYPFWRASASENAVDLAAHVVFGVITTFGLTELEVTDAAPQIRQTGRQTG
jgi:hypothetical protein